MASPITKYQKKQTFPHIGRPEAHKLSAKQQPDIAARSRQRRFGRR